MTRRCQSSSTFGKALGLLIVLICAALTANSVVAQEQNMAFEIKPGMIVDHRSGLAFLMHPDGGIDALDLTTGNIVWHSVQAGRPLAIKDDKLIAQVETVQSGRMDMVVLEAITGSVLQTATTSLPAHQVASISNGLGSSFNAWAEVEGDEVAIGWESAVQEVKGTGSTPIQRSSAGVRMDVNTGALTTGTAVPQRAAADRELRASGSSRLAHEVGRQFFSADQAHILVSELLTDRWGYQWRIYTRDGVLAGEIESPVSYAPFFVSGTLIVSLRQPEAHQEQGRTIAVPLRLLATELNTSNTAWTHELRDTTFRGPYPP